MSDELQSTLSGSMSRPLRDRRRPWRPNEVPPRARLGHSSITLIEFGTFQRGWNTIIFMSSENTGVCLPTSPVMTRSVWITAPVLTMRSVNSGMLTVTYSWPRSAGIHRHSSMLASSLAGLSTSTSLSSARVALPTMPSGRVPLSVWKAMTAAFSVSS